MRECHTRALSGELLNSMFVTVKYGDDQSKIFNINCRNEILLHHIKKRCDIDRDDIVELSDETGVVKNLRHNLMEYGYDFLKERETLILLRVDGDNQEHEMEDTDSNSDKVVFIPLLTGMDSNKEFIDVLNPKDEYKYGRKNSLVDSPDGGGKKGKNKDKKKDKKSKNTPKKT